MNALDIDTLLEELDPVLICGPNLEYDPQFVELEIALQGKPEVQYGGSITEAVSPDWKGIRTLSLELLGRSRDLRLVMALLSANLSVYGISGLADGFRLLERLLGERWDTVHPELDPDEGMDPTLRINSMAGLADAAGIIQKIKTATIVTLPGFGPLTIHMLEVATGETVVGDDEERIAVASLRAALSDVSEAVLVEVVDALARSRSSVEAIEILLVRQVGNAQALNLTPLVRILNRAHLFFAEQSPVNVISDATGNMSDRDSGAEQCSPSSRVGSTAVNGEIASRAEVIRVLDSVLRYYVQYEPSSPVPVLLSRAKRLVPKSFMQIMEDLAPDSMQQMLVFQGNAEDSHNR